MGKGPAPINNPSHVDIHTVLKSRRKPNAGLVCGVKTPLHGKPTTACGTPEDKTTTDNQNYTIFKRETTELK